MRGASGSRRCDRPRSPLTQGGGGGKLFLGLPCLLEVTGFHFAVIQHHVAVVRGPETLFLNVFCDKRCYLPANLIETLR